MNISRPLGTYGTIILIGAGLALAVTALTLQTYKNNRTSEAVFERMVKQSLSTTGFTRVTERETQGQSIEQYEQVQLVGDYKARALAEIKQGTILVQTETLATPNRDYVRYNKFETTQSGNAAKVDYSSVTGIWADSGQANQFNRIVFGVIPMAHIAADKRQQLYDQAMSGGLFEVAYDKARKTSVDGKKVYVYDVEMAPRAYVSYLKSVATAMGITAFADVDPNQYAGQANERVRLTVDIATGNLLRTEAVQTGQTEKYTSYGVHITQDVPTKAIAASELQSKIQKLFQ